MNDSNVPIADGNANNVQAALLVGGLGTRLRSVLPSVPKPLASVGGKPFLELLVLQLRNQNIRTLIMCTGHLGEQIENEFGNGSALGVTIAYSQEPQPLGTAGALSLASSRLINSRDFILMNGDSFLEVDFDRLLGFHRQHGGIATLAIRRVESAARFGTVEMGPNSRVSAFLEKTGRDAPGLINGGVYVFSRSIFDWIQPGPSSLEKDVLPRILDQGVYALEQKGMFIDIGTPADYARAQKLYQELTAKMTAFNR